MPWNPEIAALTFTEENVLLVAHYLGNTKESMPIWRSDTRTEILLPNHTGGATGIAFVPGGAFAVTTDMEQQIRLWDLSSWQPALFWSNQEGAHQAGFPTPDPLYWSPRGTYLTHCSGAQKEHLQLWSLQTRDRYMELLKLHKLSTRIRRMIFSSNEKLLACVENSLRQHHMPIKIASISIHSPR